MQTTTLPRPVLTRQLYITYMEHPLLGTATIRYRGRINSLAVTSEINLPKEEADNLCKELQKKFKLAIHHF